VPETKPRPLVVQYLYLHGPDEAFHYPTARSAPSAARVATRYLECAVTQAASLQLKGEACDLALATNITDPAALGRTGEELLRTLERLGVQMLHTEYLHRPGDDSSTYVSSRYVLDAILAAAEAQAPERPMWLTDLDCVWLDAERVFALMPPAGEIACIHFNYPPAWDVVGFGSAGRTPRGIEELARSMGAEPGLPPWVGGELLGGTAASLRELVESVEQLDGELASAGHVLPTEEQVLTLECALGRMPFRDLSAVASRIHTGPRTSGPKLANPTALGLWHLPAEKGLSLRRTAAEVRSGRTKLLRRDLADPGRTARRFNVEGVGLPRRVRDDLWIVTNKTLTRARALAA